MRRSLRFDRNARFGAATVGVVFAAYVNIATDFSAFVQAANYAGVLGTDVPAVDVAEFLLCVALYVASFAIFPSTGARRVAAVTLVSVVLFLWAAVGIERGVGNITEPAEFWVFVGDQGLVTLAASLGGWLIVRERCALSFLVLVVIFVPPIISRVLIDSSVTSGSFTLAKIGAVTLLGIGGAWLAAAIDRAVDRRGEASPHSS
ncbi:hypothetical protein [Microbacterium sp. 1.5R]|uniref:hypothetical protein n=1 Tax=Microbacterium sp. 1.5R TaxID=1916917 RepID=UPI0011A9AC56|nr:hypothetical protein [Microbacterium sp. 1.5R]